MYATKCVCISATMFVSLCVPLCVSACVPLCVLYVCLYMYHSVCPYVCHVVCLFVCQFVWLYVPLCEFVFSFSFSLIVLMVRRVDPNCPRWPSYYLCLLISPALLPAEVANSLTRCPLMSTVLLPDAR